MRPIKIHHETRYTFATPAVLGEHYLRLRPREGPDLRIQTSLLETRPAARVRWARDAFDNAVATLSFGDTPVSLLAITSDVLVEKYDEAPLDFILSDYAAYFPFAYTAEEADTLTPFFSNASEDDRLAAHGWALDALGGQSAGETYTLLDRLCQNVKRDFAYQARETPGVQSARTTLERCAGSCRDFANLFLEATRALGLAARFVSGYRYEPGLPVALGATHAWAEVYLPGAGWKGFDPTIGELTGSDHIATAVARSPTAAPPVAGALFGANIETTLDVVVDVAAV